MSALSRFGSTLGFILIALLWFYLVALTLLAGAVINSLRHEHHDTGALPYGLGRDPHGSPPEVVPEQPVLAEPYRSLARLRRPTAGWETPDPGETESARAIGRRPAVIVYCR